MKMKGIKFTSEMVEAVLAGRKTQHRMIIKNRLSRSLNKISWQGDAWYQDEGNNVYFSPMQCPFGKIGDKIFVKEDFCYAKDYQGYLGDAYLDYKASPKYSTGVWRSAHYMKQHQSRITLEITNIRVESLQDISEENVKDEGMIQLNSGEWIDPRKTEGSVISTAKECFSQYWNSIYKKDPVKSWGANPFVWVIEFKQVDNINLN